MRGLGGDRAGEMRITRFLHNPKVTADEMMATARARTCAHVAGRHVLAIQDTSAVRVDEKGVGLSFHPVIAVDANAGTVLGLVDNFFLTRQAANATSASKGRLRRRTAAAGSRARKPPAPWLKPARPAPR